MASSAFQVFGFVLAVVGLAGIIVATLMNEWSRSLDEQTSHLQTYRGLWMSCKYRIHEETCTPYITLSKLPIDIQVTRAAMLLSIFLSSTAMLVSTVGMKCTRFMDGNKKAKSNVTVAGGIMFIIAGLLSLTITSWYASFTVNSSDTQDKEYSELGTALFVSWGAAISTLIGGIFLSCRSCSPSVHRSHMSHPKLPPASLGTDYV